jgi:hypothetical protein
MKKYSLIYIFLLLSFSQILGQPFDYGNDWYTSNTDREFIKLIVDRDGIYRVYAQDLLNAGYDLSTVNPRFLHLYYRGKEVPVFVGKQGGQMTFIEFFGKRNDGQIDSIMYRDPITGVHESNLQPNKRISLYSDESAYFLTWDNIPSGNRYFDEFDAILPTNSVPNFKYTALKEYLPGEPGSEYVRGGGGPYDSFYTLNSDYITGEGYLGVKFSYQSPTTINVPTPAPANVGNPVEIKTRVFGRSNTQHILRVTMNGETGAFLDTAYTNAEIYIRTYERSHTPQNPLTGTTDFTFFAEKANTDNNNLSWLSMTYDRLPDMNGDSTLRVDDWANPNGKSYFNFDNVAGEDSIFGYDFVNRVRYGGVINNSRGRIIIKSAPNVRDIFFTTDWGIKKPKIEAGQFNNLGDPDEGAEFVIISHRGLTSSAEAYANYRDTATVNPVSVKLVYTDEIYDEYGYGTITPWAIKRFCKDALDNWNEKPKYFFLWGKGKFLTRGAEEQTMVPTYGYPATDYEFVGHFDQFSNAIRPEAAIGRVNIYNDEEGMAYLNKVREYERTPWEAWMKEGVLLGGGGQPSEQNAISDAFSFFMSIFTERPFGGKAHYFQKRSSSVIIDPTSASYHDEISGGVSLIHFFGHSTQNIQDVSIKEPQEYNNFGRYPLMIAMGCFGGDFTVGGSSFGERWVKEPSRGAIGYLGNSSAGYLIPLREYGKVAYRFLYRDMLGKPIGEAIQNNLFTYSDSLIGISYRNHGRQMNLQGDPAVIMYNTLKPDLEVNQTSVFFNPSNFSAQDDSFEINIIVNNQGLVTQDSFRISISQKLPDGREIIHPYGDFSQVRFRDTLSFVLTNSVGNAMTGRNTFDVFVDSRDNIDELSESNNRVSISRIVPGNIPAILNPTEFAIVGENQIELRASAFFMTQENDLGYIFEIDTTEEFNSPLRTNSGVVTGTSMLASWSVPFTLEDSAVYFWRVRLSKVTPVSWSTASFKYIKDQTGWAQSKLAQFTKNEFRSVEVDPIQQEWKFSQFGVNYEFFTRKNGDFVYSQNGNLLGHGELNGFGADGVVFVVLDQYTLQPKVGFPIFETFGAAKVPSELYVLKNAILNTQEGDYFILGSQDNPKVPLWTEDIFETLKQIGVSDNIKLLKDGDAFLLMGRKGHANSATEIYAPTSGTKYAINTILYGNYQRGTITSTRIGPAKSWDELSWKWYTQDPILEEDAAVSVYAINTRGEDSLIYEDIARGEYDLSTLDAKRYPFLELVASLNDTIRGTAPQLDNWHVYFTPPPDGVIDPITNFEFREDTVWEGEDVFIHLGARNISDQDMDSVKVKLYVERTDRSRLILDSLRIAPLLADGPTVEFEYEFNTLGKNLEGKVNLIVEINPDFDQPELHVFNNVYIQPFTVLVDRVNPILDVTFDGKHIIDGDIISPNPEIIIELNDDNEFLAISDSSAIELRFKKGTSAQVAPRIFVGEDPNTEFVPGTLPENKARVYFYPGRDSLLSDGEYTLRVQGEDPGGNVAGANDNFYEISFKVESKSTVTHVLNYPNPFSTSTKFVYTLTGLELPEVFQIHVFTISGKLVKVIDLLALGEVSFGRNITDYSWDGTDEYGDRLANGVYLYKVVSRMPSQNLELNDTGTADFFNNGYGKMVIMR